jgi:hypothetical protein
LVDLTLQRFFPLCMLFGSCESRFKLLDLNFTTINAGLLKGAPHSQPITQLEQLGRLLQDPANILFCEVSRFRTFETKPYGGPPGVPGYAAAARP